MVASHTFSPTYSVMYLEKRCFQLPLRSIRHTGPSCLSHLMDDFHIRLSFTYTGLKTSSSEKTGGEEGSTTEEHPSASCSPEVLSQRAEYKDVMSDLYKRGFKSAFLFPARLCITLPGGTRKFMGSVEDTRQYIKNLPKSPGST